MSFACFIRAAEHSADNLFQRSRLRTLITDGDARENEGLLAPLPRKMRANVLKRSLLCVTSDCAADMEAAILAFARAGEIKRTASDGLVRLLYSFADLTIGSVPEWQSKIFKTWVLW